MSTRSQICIKRDTPAFQDTGGIYIYKHSDGYHEGVMPILSEITKRFVKRRGGDAPYLLCQIVRAFAAVDRDLAIQAITANSEYGQPKAGDRFDCGQDYTGWGLDTEKHWDIAYLYEVDASTGDIYINGKPSSQVLT